MVAFKLTFKGNHWSHFYFVFKTYSIIFVYSDCAVTGKAPKMECWS